MDPFHLIHLEDLSYDIPIDLKQLSASQLFLVPLSSNCPISTRAILRELRKRREAGREQIGVIEGIGIYATREIRQKDRWFGIEWISYDFDVSDGLGEVTSAQLLVLIWKMHPRSTDQLAEDAEDEFIFRRERDFGLNLHLEVLDDVKADEEMTETPHITTEPPCSPLNVFTVQDPIPFIAPPLPPPVIRATSIPTAIKREIVDMMEMDVKPVIVLEEEIDRPIASTSRLPPSSVDLDSAAPSRSSIHPSRLSNMASEEDSRGSSREIEPQEIVLESKGRTTDPRIKSASRVAPVIQPVERNSRSVSPRRRKSSSRSRSTSPRRRFSRSASPAALPYGCNPDAPLDLHTNSLIPTVLVSRLPYDFDIFELEELLMNSQMRFVGYKLSRPSNQLRSAFVALTGFKEIEVAIQALDGSRVGRQAIKASKARKVGRLDQLWLWGQLNIEYASELWRSQQARRHRELLPERSPELPTRLTSSAHQVFVSQVCEFASMEEVIEFFSGGVQGFCGVVFGRVRPKYRSRALWILLKDQEHRDKALQHWDYLFYPGMRMPLYFEKGEDGKNRETWLESDLLPGVKEKLDDRDRRRGII